MKRLLLLFTLTFTAPVFAQVSIGMTMNGYFNGGTEISFDETRGMFSNTYPIDTGTFTYDYNYGSKGMYSSVSMGAVVRWANQDTNGSSKWSKALSLTYGNLTINSASSYQTRFFDYNKPYTVISGGDTTTILTDSTSSFHNRIEGTGFYTQLGFHFNRVIRTKTRILIDVGMGMRVGMSQINYTNMHVASNYLSADSANSNQVKLPQNETTNNQTLGKRQQVNGQLEVSGCVLLPLQQDADIWWLSLNINIGYGGFYQNSGWISRTTFVPAIGMNYRIVPKDQRPIHPNDVRRQGS